MSGSKTSSCLVKDSNHFQIDVTTSARLEKEERESRIQNQIIPINNNSHTTVQKY
jgi:hypothetical protein